MEHLFKPCFEKNMLENSYFIFIKKLVTNQLEDLFSQGGNHSG